MSDFEVNLTNIDKRLISVEQNVAEINTRLSIVEEDISEMKTDIKITRAAANDAGEKLEMLTYDLKSLNIIP